MKFLAKKQLKEDVAYIKISSDFILDLYERSKKLKGTEKDIILDQVKLFSKHLGEYIEKPTKLSYNKKHK
jgi:hypothetical protein